MSAKGAVYMFAGGGKSVLEELAERALAGSLRGRAAKRPRVAVSYAPMADIPEGLAKMERITKKLFRDATVERFSIAGEDGAGDPERARGIVRDADLVFLSGGDPVSGARLYAASGADAWMREARARGTAFLGLSAGAILLGAYWADWPDPPLEELPFDGGALVPCTGVVSDIVVDCHDEESGFAELGLVKEMVEKTLADPARAPCAGPLVSVRFRGIPTGAGLVVLPTGALETVGPPLFEP